MMGLHAVQAVIAEACSGEDLLALVQYDALGAEARGSIGDLGARRDACLGERFEHLRGPRLLHVRGFAEPQNLFLDFGETLETDLNGKIATRNRVPTG
jgi:hypothetical protein